MGKEETGMALYKGQKTKEIIFPLGGMGTGSIGLCGNGMLADFEIFNRPNKGSLNGMSFLAVRAEDENGVIDTRVLNGDYLKSYMGFYQQGLYHGYGFGPQRETMAGFPHFKSSDFKGEFPFATLRFSDDAFPGKVTECAYNPFIPNDDKNSSLPIAFFDITFENTTEKTLTYTAAFSFENPYGESINRNISKGSLQAVMLSHATAKKDSPAYGDITLASNDEDAFVQTYWYRGEWMDGITVFWNQFTSMHEIPDRTYTEKRRADVASVFSRVKVAPHQKGKARFVLAWNNPICEKYWSAPAEDGSRYTWKNYYATLFRDSAVTARYALRKRGMLYRKSLAFKNAMQSVTADAAVKDAALSNLSVLKSPTVLRLEDGSLWAWEGVHEKYGSCEGTCTHVWTYAYALAYLFPHIERGMRETEYTYDTRADGAVRFRTPLPRTEEVPPNTTPCVDGQMGGVIKTYREWKLSGDTEWLKSVYSVMKKTLDFARDKNSAWQWDADGDGVLEGRQHHTLDMELFGPSAWLEGFYIAALRACAEMADAVGDADGALYRSLADKGSAYLEKELFNGSYYIQKVDLKDLSKLDAYEGAAEKYANYEAGELKYQIGDGCALDQMLAEWHAHLCGLPAVFDEAHRKTALAFLYRHNFFPSVRGVLNCWRNFTLNDESGAMICTYPNKETRPKIPLPYAEECMHGFEYAFAGLLLAEGMTEEGLSVVRSVRDRYDGEKRNPYNEMECGSNYARSMAAFALLPILAGFSFDMTRGYIGFAPRVRDAKGSFSSVFGAADAFGKIKSDTDETVLTLLSGKLCLSSFGLPEQKEVAAVWADGVACRFSQENRKLSFANLEFAKTLKIVYKK